jgi:hypothetical protein
MERQKMTRHPCPHENRCAFAEPTCTEERSATCDVIHNTTPPPPKLWNPQELVAVTMTREQWRAVAAWLAYGEDWNTCRMIWWRDFCDDRKMGAENAAKYKAAALQAENLRQIIEETMAAETAE